MAWENAEEEEEKLGWFGFDLSPVYGMVWYDLSLVYGMVWV